MLKAILIALMSFFLVGNGSDKSVVLPHQTSQVPQTGTLEKMIVANGNVAMDLDLNRLNGIGFRSQMSTLRFDVAPNSFFTILVFNGDLRGPERGSMGLIPQNSAILPAALNASLNQLVIEQDAWGGQFEIAVRDGKSGFTFFNIEGNLNDYDARAQLLSMKEGRLLISKEFAEKLGQPSKAGSVVGEISITATMRPIEITQVVNGEARSSVMPSIPGLAVPTLAAGPDVIVGDLSGLAQFGSSSGTQVGLAVGTDSCNAGAVPLNWFALPNNDHPVIPQNLYRMSGGTTNDQRFEQVGQSSVKHAFTALQQNICGFGCSATASTTLGAGCSDPYTASLNSGQSGNSLGSRAWINPFTGAYPRGDSATPPNSHTGHTHTGPSHRILAEISDLNTTLNPGATYYTEAQYVTPHEYAWCVAHPGECNMNNNVSYRQYSVSGTTSFSFATAGSTVRSEPAITAWAGATINQIEPAPGIDGIGFVAFKVTNPSPGVWHYEYAVYNENLDRAIQSFSVPLGSGITVSNTGFHAPPQHPAWANDGTVGNAGYSSTPWSPTQTLTSLTWSSETFALNPNANAIRWGTLYNFRFDSNRPPQTTNATVGFFKTGTPTTVQIQGPSTPTASNGVVDGRIARDNGAPVEGTVVRLSGTQTRQTITDANGEYHFDNVETLGFYAVTPSRPNYVFSPSTRSFSQTGNRTEAVFIGVFTGDSLSPVDSAEYFVRQQYLDFLGREPDQAGFNYWSDQINQCNGEAGCIRQRRIEVSAAFFASREFQQTGSYAYGLYAGTLGRAPGYREFMLDRSQILGGSGLDQAKTALAQGFVQRPDFVARYPQSMTREEFVDAVLQTMQQRSGRNQSALRDGLLNDYDLGSRAQVVRHAAEADSFVAAEYNKAFVLMEYFGYLRRDVDQIGYNFWVNVLDNGDANNYLGMVCAFLTSTEYQRRFSTLVTHSNQECGN
jgi:hypothetical protein